MGPDSDEYLSDRRKNRDRSPKRRERTRSQSPIRDRAKSASERGRNKTVEKAKGLCAGSDEHKEQRWEEYKERGGEWSRGRWENVYYANMNKASESRKKVEAYQKTLGWGELEVKVEIEDGVYRRLDIAELKNKRAVEYKTGYVYADDFILSEVDRDSLLVEQGWKITWHFEIDNMRSLCGPSAPLLDALGKAKINVEYSYIN